MMNRLFRLRPLPLLLALLCCFTGWAQAQTSVQLNVPDIIVEGERFNITFSVNASAKGIKMPEPVGLQLLSGPNVARSHRTSIINGQRSSQEQTIYTYVFLAEKAGDYEIPSATVQVGTASYKTSSRKIKVYSPSALPSHAQGGNEQRSNGKGSPRVSDKEIFVRAIASRTQVYEQEAVLVSFKIYSQHSFEFEDVKFPEMDGAILQEVPQPNLIQLKAEEYKGKLYYTAILRQVILLPQKSGEITIPSGRFNVQIALPIQHTVSDMESFFQSGMGSVQMVQKSLQSAPLKVQVRPLPSPRPEGFTGAVGQFTLNIEAPAELTRANESIKYTLTLKGTGNLKIAQLPTPTFPEGFETYEPKEEDNITVEASGTSGSKSIEYYAVPRFAGDFEIPALTFVYFDPIAGQYKTIEKEAIKIHVDKGSDSSPTAISHTDMQQDVKYLGQDIRYLKQGSGSTPKGVPNFTLYYLLYLLIAVGASAFVFITAQRRKERADTTTYRRNKAGKTAKRWLKIALDSKASGNQSAYYEALLKGLSDYLSSKYQIPLSQMSKERLTATMQSTQLPQTEIDKAMEALAQLELARYAPDSDLSSQDRLYDLCAEVIEAVQSHKVR